MFSTSPGYHEYIRGYYEYLGVIMSTSGDIMMHVGDTMSTSEGIMMHVGGISLVHRGMFSTSGFQYKMKGFYQLAPPHVL